jgi:hypothetical protein
MRVMELPIEEIQTGLAYLKGTDPGRRRVPLDLEEPVTVMEVSPGVFELVDGFKRVWALQRRGGATAWALVREGDLLKAKALMLGLNARRNTLSFYEEAVLAADLMKKENLTLVAVGLPPLAPVQGASDAALSLGEGGKADRARDGGRCLADPGPARGRETCRGAGPEGSSLPA